MSAGRLTSVINGRSPSHMAPSLPVLIAVQESLGPAFVHMVLAYVPVFHRAWAVDSVCVKGFARYVAPRLLPKPEAHHVFLVMADTIFCRFLKIPPPPVPAFFSY